jgi:hypothetical protein
MYRKPQIMADPMNHNSHDIPPNKATIDPAVSKNHNKNSNTKLSKNELNSCNIFFIIILNIYIGKIRDKTLKVNGTSKKYDKKFGNNK